MNSEGDSAAISGGWQGGGYPTRMKPPYQFPTLLTQVILGPVHPTYHYGGRGMLPPDAFGTFQLEPVISSGLTQRSKSSSVKNPKPVADSLNVKPFLWAFFAICAALS